jgi:hypothetical protein
VAPAFTDLIGGQTQAMFPALLPPFRTSARAGCAAVVTGLTRHRSSRDLLTLTSRVQGFLMRSSGNGVK